MFEQDIIISDQIVIVAGFIRTGTSLMMQCLKDSGYYIGEKRDLRGGYFLCEHKKFIKANAQLMGKYHHKFNHMWRLRRPDKFKPDGALAKSFIRYLKNNKIQAVKFFGLTIDFWLQYDFFKKAKFIRTIRNRENVTDSVIAKQKREKAVISKRQEYYELLDNYTNYLDMVQSYDHIYVEFENMQQQPEREAKRLEKFLGKKFSINPINNDLWHHRP